MQCNCLGRGSAAKMGYMGEIGNNADNNIRAVYLDITITKVRHRLKPLKSDNVFSL